jgi:monofunctional biosynthetic peptidoglycan transglycosylase
VPDRRPPSRFKLRAGAALRAALFAAGAGLLIAVVIPVEQVVALRYVDPPITHTMASRTWDTWRETGEWIPPDHRTAPLTDLGEVPRMVITSEDDAFFHHHGFDWGGICAALDRNQEAGEVVAGGSSITQQTAKNVFLWQQRSYVRKALEVWYTFLLERLVSKERILEVYLGVAELGPHVYGADAAARHWYGKAPSELSRNEAARLTWLLPSPRTREPDDRNAGRKASRVLRRPAVFPGEDGFDLVGDAWRERTRDNCPWPLGGGAPPP